MPHLPPPPRPASGGIAEFIRETKGSWLSAALGLGLLSFGGPRMYDNLRGFVAVLNGPYAEAEILEMHGRSTIDLHLTYRAGDREITVWRNVDDDFLGEARDQVRIAYHPSDPAHPWIVASPGRYLAVPVGYAAFGVFLLWFPVRALLLFRKARWLMRHGIEAEAAVVGTKPLVVRFAAAGISIQATTTRFEAPASPVVVVLYNPRNAYDFLPLGLPALAGEPPASTSTAIKPVLPGVPRAPSEDWDRRHKPSAVFLIATVLCSPVGLLSLGVHAFVIYEQLAFARAAERVEAVVVHSSPGLVRFEVEGASGGVTGEKAEHDRHPVGSKVVALRRGSELKAPLAIHRTDALVLVLGLMLFLLPALLSARAHRAARPRRALWQSGVEARACIVSSTSSESALRVSYRYVVGSVSHTGESSVPLRTPIVVAPEDARLIVILVDRIRTDVSAPVLMTDLGA